MKTADKLTESLLAEARQEASEIEAEAGRKAAAVAEAAAKRAGQRRAEILAAAEKQAAEEERRLQVQAEMEVRRRLLEKKNEFMERAFAQALEALGELAQPAWEALMLRELLAAAGTGEEEVRVAAGDRERFAALIDQANRELSASGRRGGLRLAVESAPIEGGFILAARDYLVDRSYRAMIAEIHDRIAPEVAAVLFQP
ncbi:MAG: V-type ATP synthase subunit E [Bacteroidota bacterium]